MAEMDRRRQKQRAHNAEHGITPRTISKPVRDLLEAAFAIDGDDAGGGKAKKGKGRGRGKGGQAAPAEVAPRPRFADHKDMLAHTKRLREEMLAAAKNLDFELAARIRDEVYRLEQLDMELL
jgi:excinuclease ABC subunit B